MLKGEFIEVIQQALVDLRGGKFILVYDDDNREAETDFFIAAEFITPQSVRTMRKEGGGLIFLMISHKIGKQFDLPFLTDLYKNAESFHPVLRSLVANDIPYDTKSSFSLYINHRKTFTGITDNDRSMTMRVFAELAKRTKEKPTNEAIRIFGESFRTPGHVPICIASERPLQTRFGHTEFAAALATLSGLTPVVGGCEMMGEQGKALSKTQTQAYAEKHHLTFLEGKDIIKSWKTWSE